MLQVLSKGGTSESIQGFDLHGVDHDVNNHGNHIHGQGSVLGQVSPAMVLLLVDVDGTEEYGQNSLCDLKTDGHGYEHQHKVVEFVFISCLKDVLQLGGIGREQGYVQHSLGDRLLGRISVGIDSLDLY